MNSIVLGIPERFRDSSFDNFIVNEGNKEAVRVCKEFKGDNSLFITGVCGSGKTHLAIATLKNFPPIRQKTKEQIEKEIQEINRNIENVGELRFEERFVMGEVVKVDRVKILEQEIELVRNSEFVKARVLFSSMLKLFEELKIVFSNKEDSSEILRRFTEGRIISEYEDEGFDCVCIDDLGVERITEWQKEILYTVINSRYENCCPTIITCNLNINELLKKLDERIVSRLFGMCKILEIDDLDYRLR